GSGAEYHERQHGYGRIESRRGRFVIRSVMPSAQSFSDHSTAALQHAPIPFVSATPFVIEADAEDVLVIRGRVRPHAGHGSGRTDDRAGKKYGIEGVGGPAEINVKVFGFHRPAARNLTFDAAA